MAVGFVALLHLAVCLLAAAAAFACAARTRKRVVRGAWLALGAAPFVAANALVAWSAIALRFQAGAENVPWLAAVLLLAAHVFGWMFLRVRARVGGGAAAWPLLPVVVALVAAATLEAVVLRKLERAGRERVVERTLEAVRIAGRERPGRVLETENAAPAYERAAHVLDPEAGPSVGDWSDALQDDRTLDTADLALRAALAGWSATLADARAATKLPHCAFDAPDEAGLAPVPRVVRILRLSEALALEARVRAADGDVRGALEDVTAQLALARHLLETPYLVSTAVAAVVRDGACASFAHVLASDRLTSADLAGFEVDATPPLRDVIEHALVLEEAFGLEAIRRIVVSEVDEPAAFRARLFSQPGSRLYAALQLERDVRGYQFVFGELRALAAAPVEELARAARRDQAARGHEVRAQGLLATLLVPNVEPRLLACRATDARTDLARLALQAARYRSEHGRYPSQASELGADATRVRVEGDGTFVLLRDLTPGFEHAPELRVPPRVE